MVRAGMPSQRAFTLIEVLLAVSLLLAISAGMLSYLYGLLHSRDRLVRTTDEQISAAALFEQLETDLSTTFAVNGAGKAGVEGTASSLVVRSRGVASTGATGVSDLGDLQGCEVKFDLDSRGLLARRLGRTEESFEVLASSVGRVRFRYFDGAQWQENFNSATAGTLPVAVEAALWFDGEDPSSSGEAETSESVPPRAPDRVRVMVVPDGPAASWKSHL
jgi:prepilin-type N-terminal cleavage/methylation domain-containing protein